jgi:predicted unusual protein kinase regulating ubiquinone biosynthesis (AarF/ABC1/UbiB family)
VALVKEMKQGRRLPTGRISRFAKLASLGAQTGVQLLTSRDATAAATKAAEVLGTLRGLAAKVGQMASYVEGAVPDAYRGAYEQALKSLHNGTSTSDPIAVRRVIESELGAPIERLFLEWEETPFASASIGQVHRARLSDGRQVAVKVQHPGIEQAVENDLRNAGVLQAMAGTLLPRGVDTKRVFNDVKDRFRDELSYRKEAKNQETFARIHASDPNVLIPHVVAERSSQRVLTTDFVTGLSLAQAAALPEAERKKYCATLWRFEFRSLLQSGIFNADPHPGNFFFLDSGRVAFIDFGCVQQLEEPVRLAINRIHAAALRHNESDFKWEVAQLLGSNGGTYERAIVEYIRHCFRPVFESPFRLTPDYVKSVVLGIRGLKGELFAKDGSFVMPPRGLTFLSRLQLGFYSILAKLDTSVDYANIESEFCDSESPAFVDPSHSQRPAGS